MRGASGRKIIGKNRVSGPSGTPSSLTATTYSSSQINLTWVNGDASSETRIYRGASLVYTAAAAATSWSGDTGLSAGTAYSYTVKHYKSSTEGTASSASSATTNLNVPTGWNPAEFVTMSGADVVGYYTLNWTNAHGDASTEIWINGSLSTTTSAGATSYSSGTGSLGAAAAADIRHVRSGIYSAYFYGGSSPTTSTTVNAGSYGTITIDSSQTFNRPSTWNNSNNYLSITGGGGGSVGDGPDNYAYGAGGGGASGGYNINLASTITITIGAGGSGSDSSSLGNTSSVPGITSAVGGNGGGGYSGGEGGGEFGGAGYTGGKGKCCGGGGGAGATIFHHRVGDGTRGQDGGAGGVNFIDGVAVSVGGGGEYDYPANGGNGWHGGGGGAGGPNSSGGNGGSGFLRIFWGA